MARMLIHGTEMHLQGLKKPVKLQCVPQQDGWARGKVAAHAKCAPEDILADVAVLEIWPCPSCCYVSHVLQELLDGPVLYNVRKCQGNYSAAALGFFLERLKSCIRAYT